MEFRHQIFYGVEIDSKRFQSRFCPVDDTEEMACFGIYENVEVAKVFVGEYDGESHDGWEGVEAALDGALEAGGEGLVEEMEVGGVLLVELGEVGLREGLGRLEG